MNGLQDLSCLVTGGAGFIGSHLCDRLVSEGAKVACFDNLSTGRLVYLKNIRRRRDFRFIRGDLLDRNLVFSTIRRSDIVFHLGAKVGVKRYVENPAEVIQVNVLGTHNVLEACLRHKVRKLVFASTSEVYGKNPDQPLSEDSDRLLGPPAVDRWCYSTSKALDEHLVNAFHRTHGLATVILRYFNSYGPRQDASDYGGVVSMFMRRLKNDESPLVHGTGLQTRSFSYIGDTIEGTYQAATNDRVIGETFNLGNPVETRIADLADLVCRVSGKGDEISPKRIQHDEFYGQWYEDIPRRVPDIGKAKKLLGFDPKIGLEEGLRLTWQWYSTQK
jgi:UDP-glucose 4-epimerase